jgi:hypothetical protein
MEEWPEEMDTRIEQETTLRWRRLRDHHTRHPKKTLKIQGNLGQEFNDIIGRRVHHKWCCNSYRRCDALSFYYKYTPLKEV